MGGRCKDGLVGVWGGGRMGGRCKDGLVGVWGVDGWVVDVRMDW